MATLESFLEVILAMLLARLRGSYQDPTWGDINVIQSLASSKDITSNLPTVGSKVSSVVSSLGPAPSHLQQIRNASIHTDAYAINMIRHDIFPHYLISTLKYPTDVIFATERYSGKIAITYWSETIIGYTTHL
jgi:hypothetical protein